MGTEPGLEPKTLTCPNCGNLVNDTPLVRNLTVCACQASLVIEGGGCRRARAEDTTVLSVEELAVLRKARKKLREAA